MKFKVGDVVRISRLVWPEDWTEYSRASNKITTILGFDYGLSYYRTTIPHLYFTESELEPAYISEFDTEWKKLTKE